MKKKFALVACLGGALCNVSFAEEYIDYDYSKGSVLSNLDSAESGNDGIVAFGLSGHNIKAGSAKGVYISGLVPVGNTDFGVYARGDLISDEYKTGHFWSWNMAVGAGYYLNDWVTPIVSVGKCFSNYSTCYFNLRHPTANDDDIDAIYYGLGAYINDPFFGGVFEISGDWSPYKGYNGRTLYIGYGMKF